MDFRTFEKAARAAYDSIPDEYREGVDGLVVSREALPHPTRADIYTLGLCLTESYLSDWQGPETTRSVVVLYWGSFRKLAELDPSFDWEDELWETLTHELRHHLESLAGEDALEGVDYAVEETFRRDDGQDFDPWYYQRGDVVGEVPPSSTEGSAHPGSRVYRVERNYYIEQVWPEDAFAAVEHLAFTWHGRTFRIPRPDELGDVHFVWIDGVDTGAATLELVLVRRRSWWSDVKRLSGTYTPVVLESEARAEPVTGSG